MILQNIYSHATSIQYFKLNIACDDVLWQSKLNIACCDSNSILIQCIAVFQVDNVKWFLTSIAYDVCASVNKMSKISLNSSINH